MDVYEEAVLFTISQLESRLDRLEYVLHGSRGLTGEKPSSLTERVQHIERMLRDLSAKTALLNDVQTLVSEHADVVYASARAKRQDEPELPVAEKAALVVERAPAFATTASQLKALDDQQVPAADAFTKLAKLRPRIAELEELHLQQALEFSLLRRRTALLCQEYSLIIRNRMTQCWVEWNKRCRDAEMTIRRAEFKQKQLLEEG
ncbi:hypothetical protein M011DRAFT_410903 [Sporormia fimetaria CBS 119925]|uniref:Uncharacterized protein n=1 Tax=Sporormia fimetaria CBS 119925 TaxID=1340428 RepID=A0A6A6V0I0_9PLEO|nr:hypothetical protein M011DRAFT_410903 [Sporormia fimetaria CBS 119925]